MVALSVSSRRRQALVAFAAVAAVARPSAHAGNDDSFFQGNDGAMLGGAVAAVGEGPDMIWYNPAGLAGNTRSRIELSGSMFSLRLRSVDPYLGVAYADGTTDTIGLDSREIQTVPSALSFARQLGRVTVGLGVFVPVQDALAASRSLRVDRDGTSLELASTATFQHARIHAGPGLGVQLGRLRLGASLFGVYEKVGATERPTLSVESPEVRLAATQESRFELTRFSLELVLGAQLELPRGVVLAATVRGPRIRLADRIDYEVLGFGAFADDTGASDFAFVREEGRIALTDRRAILAAPVEVLVGLGWRGPRARLGADVRVSHAYDGLLESVAMVNVRLGGAFRISPTVELGAGVFTDRTHLREGFAALALLDYYGASLGLTLDTPVAVRAEAGESSRPVIFRTTVALRYAAGVGGGFGLLADLAAGEDDDLFVPLGPSNVVFHDISLYVGSGLDF